MNRVHQIAIIALTLSTLATPVIAGRCGPHPPIHVATRLVGPITPYMFPYGGNYRYDRPGPVYCELPVWHPHHGCWRWRYNYLYWTCDGPWS
jgi:hypothetical protein